MAICNIEQGHIARQIQALRNSYKLANLQYIKYVIEVNLGPIISYANGIIPGLPRDILLDLILPLPPLAEQRRIVKAVDELFEQIDIIERSEKELEEAANKTRDKLLNLAIQGHLVPQDPNEEPASVLLERIRAEKARLVKEGKLKKKDLEEKPISPDEIPFDIPEGWVWCRLGDIGDWGAGATPFKGNPNYYNGDVLWLRTGELNNDVVYDTEIKITETALKECSLRLNKIGDVLIAMYGATIGKVAIVGAEMTTNQACCACSPICIFNWYLFYFLMASKSEFIKKGEGGAQPNISRDKLINHLFPLPPLSEQRRIVSKLEELLHEIDKLKG